MISRLLNVRLLRVADMVAQSCRYEAKTINVEVSGFLLEGQNKIYLDCVRSEDVLNFEFRNFHGEAELSNDIPYGADVLFK